MAVQGIKMTVSAGEEEEEPWVEVVAVSPVPAAVGDVSGSGVVIDHPPSLEDEREEGDAVLVEQEDDHLSDEDFSDEEEDDDDTDDEDDDTDDEEVDSDSEFEDDVHVVAPAAAPAVTLAANFVFLGRPTRCASVVSTTGFMRLAATEAAPAHDGGGGGEILVHYRYTRFFRAQSGGPGVDMHVLGPKLACVRFHLPSGAASDPASSLRLAGASLASLAVYPARFNVHLRALWSGLIAAAPVRVPPRTTRLVVTVDVGILRPEDYTAERMRRMRAALESVARKRDAQPGAFDASMELHLPGPLAVEDEVRPTKRRRVTGDDCPICWEALERGLAAWPRCSHIFHGRCLEEHLLRGHQECPMCRSDLKVNNAASIE